MLCTQQLQQCWCEVKPWTSHSGFCNITITCDANEHYRVSLWVSEPAIHLSVSPLALLSSHTPVAMQYSRWRLRFHMAQYQKPTWSHSILNVTAEKEHAIRRVWASLHSWGLQVNSLEVLPVAPVWKEQHEEEKHLTNRSSVMDILARMFYFSTGFTDTQ